MSAPKSNTAIVPRSALDALAEKRREAARKAVATRKARQAEALANGITFTSAAKSAGQKAAETRRANAAAKAAEAAEATRVLTHDEKVAIARAEAVKRAKAEAERIASEKAAVARVARYNEWKALAARAREVGVKCPFSAVTDANLVAFAELVEGAEAEARDRAAKAARRAARKIAKAA